MNPEQEAAVTQDLAGIVSRFRRHVPIGLAIIAVMMVLAYGATKMMTPKYSASAQLSYSPQPALTRDGQPAPPPIVSDAARDAAVESQLQIANSLPVAIKALQNPVVANNPQIQARAKAFDPTGKSSDALAASVLASVTTARVGTTPFFTIGYSDVDPLAAARIANALADAYLVVQAQQKLGQGSATSGQLKEQVDKLRQQAQTADAAVAAYRLKHNILVDPTIQSPDNELSNIGVQLSDARGAAALAQSRSAVSGSTIISGGVDTTALSTLREQRAEASRDLAGLTSRYGDRNPQVIDARQKVSDLDDAIAKEMASMSRSARAESAAAAARSASLQASLAQAQSKLAGNVNAGVELAELQRKSDNARALYANLLTASGQQNANSALIQPDAQLVTPAVAPLTPTSPRMIVNLLLGFVFGLAIAIAVAYLRERWSQTIDTIDDVQRLLGVDFLTTIPTLQSAIDKPKTRDPAEAVIQHPLSSYAEAFRSLAQTLIFDARKSDKPGARVIGVGSALPREGKTTTTISIARVLAMGATKVVLVDADLRRRSVTETLAPSTKKGWIDVLNGTATLSEVMIEDSTGAIILPIAPGSERAQRVFDGDAFEKMIAHLREHFEVVVIDTAPVLALVDTRAMMPHLDAFVLLAHWRTTPVKAIRAALHQLETVGAAVTGVAMTMVNLKTQAQSGYGDASYYYSEMKDYYVSS
jgi:succinoglycan biosynthesis transport protein ExoP